MAQWKFIVTRALKGYGQDRCSSFAAAISYYALLSVFPLAIFAVALAGYFLLARDPSSRERVLDALMNNLPLDPQTRPGLRDALSGVAQAKGKAGLFGLVAAAYSASALFGAVRTALSVVFRVERQRPMIQGKLLDLGMVVGLGTLMLLSLALTAGITILQNFSADLFGASFGTLSNVLLGVAYVVLPAAVSVGVFMIAYKVIPHAELSWRDTFPGALVAAIGFEVLKIGFAQYAARIGNYNKVYGTLGFVVAFLAFAYFASQIVLLGAELTRSYVEVSSGAVPAAKPAVPKRAVSLPARVQAMVKGLFVAPEPHHDDSLPYAPAKTGGPLTDAQAEQKR